MQKTYCDICGKEINSLEKTNVEITVKFGSMPTEFDTNKYELCKKCAEELGLNDTLNNKTDCIVRELIQKRKESII